MAAPAREIEQLLSAPEVAKRLGVAESTLWHMCRTNLFPKPLRLGPRLARWRVADLNTWVEQQQKAAR